MTFLASTDRSERQATQSAAAGVTMFDVGGPAPLEGLGTATGLGIGRGLASTGAALYSAGEFLQRVMPTTAAATYVSDQLREALGTQDEYEQQQQDVRESIRAAVNYYRPDPLTTGWAGQISYGVGSTLLPAVLGAVAGGPVGAALTAGGAVGTGTYADLTAEGVDESTALRAASIDALATGVGVAIPASMGVSLFARVGSGALLNAGVGVGQRYAMGEYLRGAGYGEIASRYDAFDGMALATDVILGAAFGVLPNGKPAPAGVARPSQASVDAALTQRQVQHAEVQAAPGIPATAAAAGAHARASADSLGRLANGQPVEPAPFLEGAEFIAKPTDPTPDAAALAEAYPDAGPMVDAAARRDRAEIAPVDEGVAEIRGPDGKLLGNLLTEEWPDAITIRGIELEPEARGRGIGGDLYRRLADQALAQDKVLRSDAEVTVDAARRYDALERQGYTVKRNPAAKLGEDGKWRTPDDSPVFEVAAKAERAGSARATDATGRAATPEAQAAESSLSEATKAADEMPDARVIYGDEGEDGAPMTMADAVDAIRAEREQAERDAQGITAAVMCFLRRGGE